MLQSFVKRSNTKPRSVYYCYVESAIAKINWFRLHDYKYCNSFLTNIPLNFVKYSASNNMSLSFVLDERS